MTARSGWDLVVFDCDGVLVDSEPIANETLADMLRGLGLAMSVEEVTETFLGLTVPQCLERIETMLGRPTPPDFFPTWRTTLYAAFRDRPVRAVPGVEDALAAIDAPLCVVSNGPIVKMQTTLGVTGLLPRFAGRLFSPDCGLPGKPRPDLFLAAARAVGADTRRTAVIEDTGTGARGARAAGMKVFGYVGGERPDRDALAAAGAVLFTDMRRLPALLAAGPDGGDRRTED